MDSMDYGKLGNRIKEERKKRGISREKIAEELNISASYVGQIERAERCLTVDTLVSIANILGLSVDYLLCDSLDAAKDTTGEEWKRLTQGKTVEEKKILIEMVGAFERYKGR